MGDRRRLYNLQSSRGDGLLVQSVSDDYDDDDLLLSGTRRQSGRLNYLKLCVICLSVVAVFMSGYFAHVLVSGFGKTASEHKIDNIASVIDPVKIREYHKELTKSTHLAGDARNFELAKYVADKFHEFAFDNVEFRNYSVRLPYPDKDNPNSVKLFNSSGTLLHNCSGIETPLTDFEKSNPTTPLFNAHSKEGTVKKSYVYVNLASKKDFQLLQDHNITVKDKIVLARYGQTFRGNKVQNAADAGALAIVLFKDMVQTEEVAERYPQSEFAPSSAGERGTVLLQNGDIDTLGWPSVETSFQKAEGPLISSSIISQPITGDDAIVLLKALPKNPGFELPNEWGTGLLKNTSFGIGTDDGPLLEVTVNADVRRVNITNVIGTITGSVEPDRWVILGNHRDAWTYGAIDPSSGTAAVLEVGRSLSHFLGKGWRPRRTIKLCSWDAEEWGLIGSLEWIEENRALLQHRAVIYINTDIAEGGQCYGVDATGSPLYQNITATVLDGLNSKKMDKILLSGSGSDMYGFYCYAGVSVLDVNCATWADLYHTIYDTQQLFEIVDKDYKNLAKVATSLAELVIGVSEPPLVPGRVVDYTNRIQEWWDAIKPKVLETFSRLSVDEELIRIIDVNLFELGKAADTFQSEVLDKLTKESSVLDLRRANDALLQFDRSFLVDKEIPGTSFYSKNILVSPSATDLYAGSGFPGLQYVTTSADITKDMLFFELERVRWALHAAASVLALSS